MEIAALKYKSTNRVVLPEIVLNERVKILALGILSSAVVLAALQPPASIVFATVILVASIVATLPSHVQKSSHVFNERYYPLWKSPKEVVVIPRTFPTPTEWRASKPLTAFESSHEPVGRKKPFISVVKKPDPLNEEQRVLVGERKERHGDRVPVGVR